MGALVGANMMILLLSLFSPITETFPNLYMSWWRPSNGNIEKYQRTWYRRVVVVLVVWLPILYAMSRIVRWPWLVFMTVLIFGAFIWRLIAFTRELQAELDGTTSTVHADLPEVPYVVALITLMVTIYLNLDANAWLVPVGGVGIFAGAVMIGRFRSVPAKSQRADIAGRLIFSAGFILNLFNLATASGLA